MIWSHQSTCWLFEEQCTTDLSLTELLNIYTGWCYHIKHHIKIQYMLTLWRAISNWIYLDTFPQYIQGWCDHIIDMITSMIRSHHWYDHINDMITSTIWSHQQYDHINDMITYTVWSHRWYDHINVIITSTVIWLIHNVYQWLLEIQPILDNGDNRLPQVNADFLRLFEM